MTRLSSLSCRGLAIPLIAAAGLLLTMSFAGAGHEPVPGRTNQKLAESGRRTDGNRHDSRSRSVDRVESREFRDDRGESFPRPWSSGSSRTREQSRTQPRFQDGYDTFDTRPTMPVLRAPDDVFPSETPPSRPLGGWEPVDLYDSFNASQPREEIRWRLPQDERVVPSQPLRATPARKPVDERPSIQDELTNRYQDGSLLRFAAALQPEQGLALYGEVLTYIAQRHLQPPAPQAMVQRGLYNLSQALKNPAFQQTTRLPAQAAQLDQVLGQLAQQPVSRNEDAVALLRKTMQAAQPFGLPASIVAVEFIEGAIDGLDRFSAFLPEETARSQSQQLGESLVGIGVTIEAADGGMSVVKTIAGSPAAQAGLQKGDLLVSVNGRTLNGVGLDGAISLITGPEGSAAVVGLTRNGRTTQLQITRRRVQVHSVVDVQMIDTASRIGYLKLETFSAQSKREMDAALQLLHQQGMQALIVDLRGNPGGLLTTAIELSDVFLPEGTIVATRGRTPSDDSSTQAHKEQTWKVPLVVLIDEDSASASEIMAAAIQDHGRGVIVGRHSYGKGTVQTLFPLKSAGCSLRLTTARFYSPAGKPMAGEGIEPDVLSNEGTDAQGRELDVLAGINVARQLLNTSR